MNQLDFGPKALPGRFLPCWPLVLSFSRFGGGDGHQARRQPQSIRGRAKRGAAVLIGLSLMLGLAGIAYGIVSGLANWVFGPLHPVIGAGLCLLGLAFACRLIGDRRFLLALAGLASSSES